MRLFVAIKLGDELKAELYAVQLRLQEMARARNFRLPVRWVAPETIHLTLKFLGEVDAARVPGIKSALDQSSADLMPFTLTVRGLGCFPTTRRPSVIWAGLDGQAIKAVELAGCLEDSFSALGYSKEARLFSPHLTLGRVKREASPADRAATGASVEAFPARELGIIEVNAVHLIESDLKPEGPIYTTLASVGLHDPVPRPV